MKKRTLLRSSLIIIVLLTIILLGLLGLSFNRIAAATPDGTDKPANDIINDLNALQGPEDDSHTSSSKRYDNSQNLVHKGLPVEASSQQPFYSIADATILQGYPSFNGGNTIDMWAGYDEYLDPNGQTVSYTHLTLPTIA